ncbi:hypothetical protein NA57DRAFT_72200 [Rhizodiscina lignyota]|uniref:TLC domain-containing protein n=1 Tax=Rhizodiscina lignyota TaxID=1504668 RepID=A0A9P4IKG7_9PEZI|nr:hypothetical protein NA57DRAFT_72200 [Rhizodiscina lignyota]
MASSRAEAAIQPRLAAFTSPFGPPMASNVSLSPASNPQQFWAENFTLHVFHLHAYRVLSMMALYQALYSLIIPSLACLLAPATYPKLVGIHRRRFLRVSISMIQSSIATYFALRLNLFSQRELAVTWQDRICRYEDDTAKAMAYALGYLVWHFLETLVNWEDHSAPMKIHGLVTSTSVALFFRPAVHYYARQYLFMEMSNLCINIQRLLKWSGNSNVALDKFMSRLVLVGWGALRLVYGPIITFNMTWDFAAAARAAPVGVLLSNSPLVEQLGEIAPLNDGLYDAPSVPVWISIVEVVSTVTLIWESWVWFVGIWRKGDISNGKVKAG